MHMRVRRQCFINACHFHIKLVVSSHDLVDRIFVTKIFFRTFFGEHYRKRSGERGFGVSPEYFNTKDIEKIFISEEYILFVDELLFIAKRSKPVVEQPRHFLDLGKIGWQVIPKWR